MFEITWACDGTDVPLALRGALRCVGDLVVEICSPPPEDSWRASWLYCPSLEFYCVGNYAVMLRHDGGLISLAHCGSNTSKNTGRVPKFASCCCDACNKVFTKSACGIHRHLILRLTYRHLSLTPAKHFIIFCCTLNNKPIFSPLAFQSI